MVDKDVSQDGELAVDGRNLAEGTLEWGTEALQRGWSVELVDFKLDLAGDEFALEI